MGVHNKMWWLIMMVSVTGYRITQETHLRFVWEGIYSDLTEERPSLYVGGTSLWVESQIYYKGKIKDSASMLLSLLLNCRCRVTGHLNVLPSYPP